MDIDDDDMNSSGDLTGHSRDTLGRGKSLRDICNIDTIEEEGDAPSKKHKKYKKLPSKDAAKAESSKSAADDVLRKFFNRR